MEQKQKKENFLAMVKRRHRWKLIAQSERSDWVHSMNVVMKSAFRCCIKLSINFSRDNSLAVPGWIYKLMHWKPSIFIYKLPQIFNSFPVESEFRSFSRFGNAPNCRDLFFIVNSCSCSCSSIKFPFAFHDSCLVRQTSVPHRRHSTIDSNGLLVSALEHKSFFVLSWR